MNNRIDELDGVRALALSAVLAIHGSYGWIRGGFLGVDLFFVLSGFLITSLLINEYQRCGTISLPDFYRRRALRILPPLAVGLIIAWALWPPRYADFSGAAPPVLLFYANMVTYQQLGPLSHLWSLAVEEQFYFFWPLACVLLVARPKIAVLFLLGSIGLVVALRAALFLAGVEFNTLYRITPTRADALAIGCLLAFMAAQGWRMKSNAVLVGVTVLIVVCFFTATKSSAMMLGGFTLFAALCGLMIAGLLDAPESTAIRALARCRLARYLGRRSYGIYVYHLPIFVALEPLRRPHDLLNVLLVFALRMAITLVVAEASYRWIETPILRKRSRQRVALAA